MAGVSLDRHTRSHALSPLRLFPHTERVPYMHYNSGTTMVASSVGITGGSARNPEPDIASDPPSSGVNDVGPTSPASSSPPTVRRVPSARESTMFRAAFKYEPQGPQEIPLEAGALVK